MFNLEIHTTSWRRCNITASNRLWVLPLDFYETRGNLNVIRNWWTQNTVDSLDSKVYCYCLFTVVGEKREIEYRKKESTNFDRENKQCEAKRTDTDPVFTSSMTPQPSLSGPCHSSVPSMLLMLLFLRRPLLSRIPFWYIFLKKVKLATLVEGGPEGSLFNSYYT